MFDTRLAEQEYNLARLLVWKIIHGKDEFEMVFPDKASSQRVLGTAQALLADLGYHWPLKERGEAN